MKKHFVTFLLATFAAKNALAIPSFKQSKQQDVPAVLKADEVNGDKIANSLTAIGNVEVSKGNSVIYADEMVYNKDKKTIRAIGNVKVKNIEIGNMRATEAEVQDDFSKGTFLGSVMFFNDGAYFSSPKVDRETANVTTFYKSIYSFCPNDEIKENNDLAGKKRDFASIKSSKSTINRETEMVKTKHGFLRIYNVPLLYIPYIQFPLPAKKRQSGFLSPSYTKTTNFGIGAKIPYYWNIAPNKDLTVTPQLHLNSNQFILNNDFRHIADYGQYSTSFEFANNKLKTNLDRTVVTPSKKEYRWNLKGVGAFDFSTNLSSDFALNTVSDRNYLRNYHFDYLAYTISKGDVNYINGRNYHSARTVRVQELEDVDGVKSAAFVLPSLDSHIESKPMFFKEKFALTSNVTAINRDSGLQYRRATLIPEASIPFNLKGNLFNLGAKFQGDFYWLENNFKHTPPNNNYELTQTNYKPEISLQWHLPLIKKAKSNTLMIEPMVNFVSSSYKKSYTKLPDEDGNSSELSVSNLFINDRIAGYDRNEAGERINYGLKSSLFNKYGEFGLTVGQVYRKSDELQDVSIRGFVGEKKSNIVGQAMYKTTQNFSLYYYFQLNESNYSNDVNQVTANLNLDRFSFSSDYLLIRRTPQNLQERRQINLSSSVKLSSRWKVTLTGSKDLALNRVLSRGITLYRDGCCTVFGFSMLETNPSNLIKPQRTFNLSLSFKNL